MRRGLFASTLALALCGMRAAALQPVPGTESPAAQEERPPLVVDDTIKRMLMEGPRGSLAITVVQGTKAGPPISELELRVDLYHRNDPIYEMIAATDKSGVVLMGDLPVALRVRPVVRAEYGGVSYLEVGQPMSAEAPDGVVKLTVYETTDAAPAWRVAMRHVMVSRADDGYVLEETMVVENPADSTWLGGEPDERENRTTVRAELPQGAAEVELIAGFHGWCCTKLEGRELAVQMPLMPGQTTYRFAYFVPSSENAADLSFAAPAETVSMVLFVPDDGSTAEPASVEAGGTQTIESARVRMYQGRAIGAGTEAGVRLVALPAAQPSGGSGGGLGTLPMIGIALGVLVILGAVVMWMKKA